MEKEKKEIKWKYNRTFKRFIHCLKENHAEKIFLDRTKCDTFEDFFENYPQIQHFVDYSFTWGSDGGIKWSYVHYQWSYICATIENVPVNLDSLINKTYVGAKQNPKTDIYADFFRIMKNNLLKENKYFGWKEGFEDG